MSRFCNQWAHPVLPFTELCRGGWTGQPEGAPEVTSLGFIPTITRTDPWAPPPT